MVGEAGLPGGARGAAAGRGAEEEPDHPGLRPLHRAGGAHIRTE